MTRVLAALLLAAAPVAADVVVLTDRTVREGQVARGDGHLTVGGEKLELARVLLWEDGAGIAQYAASAAAHVEGLAALAERAVLARCRELFDKAVAEGRAERARDLLARAERAGLPPKEAEEWDARIAKAGEAGAGDAAPLPGRAELADLLADRARKAVDAGDRSRGLYLLRATLERDPEHQAALAMLEELAPRYPQVGDGSKRLWLDWEVEVFQTGVRLLGRRHPVRERAKALWRKDITAIETPEMSLVTSMTEPRPVGHFVRLARLAFRALDDLFATDAPKRTEFLPLVVYFYESREEYLENVTGGNPQHASFLGLTLGFYTAGENVSRFFWPAGPGAERSVSDTFVHELTHHWIQRRCPRFDAGEALDRSVELPGYWIVEGFAVFVQEGRYDPEHGEYSHFNPHAPTLDQVAWLSEHGTLMAWEELFPLSQAKFQDLEKEYNIPWQRRWSLRAGSTAKIRMFYEQAGATCHFLYWGENGKYREKLIDYVTAYYTGDAAKTDVKAAFGLTPQQLGAKVEAFAKQVMSGWRP